MIRIKSEGRKINLEVIEINCPRPMRPIESLTCFESIEPTKPPAISNLMSKTLKRQILKLCKNIEADATKGQYYASRIRVKLAPVRAK